MYIYIYDITYTYTYIGASPPPTAAHSRRGPTGCSLPLKRLTGHTHTQTDREQPPRHRHTHTTRATPQTNTSHKHLTTVRTTSHARVGGRAEVSVGGRVEVRRGLRRARVRLSINTPTIRLFTEPLSPIP